MTNTDDQLTKSDPPHRKTSRAKLAIAGAVLAVAAVGGGTYAVLQGTDAGASSATGGAMTGGGPGGGQGGGTGGPPSGTVVSTTADSITVKLSSGTETTYTLADGATVQDDGNDVALTDLAAGEQVMIFTGQPGSDSTEATRVLAGTSAQARPGGGAAPDGAQQGTSG